MPVESVILAAGDTGHEHTVTLGPSGNGESTEADGHMHLVEADEVMEAGEPAHTHALEVDEEVAEEEAPAEEAPPAEM